MNWKKHPPTCTCGKCVNDRASRESQKAIAQARMTGQPVPLVPPQHPKTCVCATCAYNSVPARARQAYWPTVSTGYSQRVKTQMAQQLGYVPDRSTLNSYVTMQTGRYSVPADTPNPVTIDSIPEETDLVRGWRTYTIDAQGRLKGSRVAWETAEFTATCEDDSTDVVTHLLNGCPYPSHAGCGIYSHKVGPEYLKTERPQCTSQQYESPVSQINVVAQCISSGVVVEHEHGYRAERCRIEQMWLVTPRRCANGHWVKMDDGQAHQPTEIKWHRETDSTGRDWMVTNYGPGVPAGLMSDLLVFLNTQQQIEADIRARAASTPPHWTCSETPVDNPGAAYAQVLSTKYGVPCTAMPTVEFIAKLDEGSL